MLHLCSIVIVTCVIPYFLSFLVCCSTNPFRSLFISMLKHPASQYLGLDCVHKSLFIFHPVESIYYILNRFIKVSDYWWIDSKSLWIISYMNRLTSLWNASQNSLTLTESIQLKHESYQSSSWVHLNQFINTLNCFIFHAFSVCFLCSESIQSIIESIHSVKSVRKLCLVTSHYINPSPHNSQLIESFASILSRSQKLIEHKFFKIQHFFLESLFSLRYIDFLGCYTDCSLVFSRRLIGFNQGFEVNWRISFHLQRAWGSF